MIWYICAMISTTDITWLRIKIKNHHHLLYHVISIIKIIYHYEYLPWHHGQLSRWPHSSRWAQTGHCRVDAKWTRRWPLPLPVASTLLPVHWSVQSLLDRCSSCCPYMWSWDQGIRSASSILYRIQNLHAGVDFTENKSLKLSPNLL